MLLIGIIPDFKHEPPINSFITPLVYELREGWSEGFHLVTHKSPKHEVTFKVALLCIGCDIPATRKLCGFIGNSTGLGCSKCLKKFPGDFGKKDYSGFDSSNWPQRTKANYLSSIKTVQNARTRTEKESLESSLGVKYSKLSEIEYFDPVRMSIIDPMHNLFQGTAKEMMKSWLRVESFTP